MTKILRVDLADLESIPHASAAAGTAVEVGASYTGDVVLTDGTVIPRTIKVKTMGNSGRVQFEVHASDDPDVAEDYRGFAVEVVATLRTPTGAAHSYRRTVKPLQAMSSPIPLGTLPAAEPLPPEWATVDEVLSDFDDRLDALEARPQLAASTDAYGNTVLTW